MKRIAPMTLARLHKELGKLLPKYGRRYVCVKKSTFTHPLESDGVVYIDVHGVRTEALLMVADDGGTEMRADGSEVTRPTVILFGPDDSREVIP